MYIERLRSQAALMMAQWW